MKQRGPSLTNFYSRASCEARLLLSILFQINLHISTHAPHARRGSFASKILLNASISTHAPHARRGSEKRLSLTLENISTHAPHARRGASYNSSQEALVLFLLTRLMRGAAKVPGKLLPKRIFLLTRLMRGAAYILNFNFNFFKFLLTRLMRGAALNQRPGKIGVQFLLTRLMRGAAAAVDDEVFGYQDFYSRASCEARLLWKNRRSHQAIFLLTRLMRGAALSFLILFAIGLYISTHAPHARRGLKKVVFPAERFDFYSRASCEARQRK